MNPDHAVVAFGAAVFAIIGLLLLISWLLDQVAKLRAQVAYLGDANVQTINDNETLRRIMRANGMLPPAPPPLPEERKL